MREQIPIRVFDFEVNAIFAKETLSKLGVETTIKEIEKAGRRHFELLADSTIKEKASNELEKLNLDDTPIHKDSEGYFEGVNEWLDHMYNPVYYLERKKLPHFFYDKSTIRLLGVLFLIPGLAILISNSGNNLSSLFSILFGLTLIWQSNRKKK